VHTSGERALESRKFFITLSAFGGQTTRKLKVLQSNFSLAKLLLLLHVDA